MATKTMGVVNVTPDSFVGELCTPDVGSALERCRRLVAEGADIVDIGGESTRPGARPVSVEEELQRVVPVVEAIGAELPDHVRLSIDTRNEPVARAAVAAGADIINDMSASLGAVAGELGVGFVAAHMQGTPATMQRHPRYDRVVDEVIEATVGAARAAAEAGASPVWIDPGIGFGKNQGHNLELLAGIDRMVASGFPVVVGVSRKGMTGRIHTASDRGRAIEAAELGPTPPTPTDDRLEASLAIATWCALLGVDVVRVHDVAATAQAMKVVAARP